ncbi:hypothetical protein G9A89_000536 [Geosiphon pyriformis]|nr:hypothetical protein G9A89_000536 [Geosiphon pyriformis]
MGRGSLVGWVEWVMSDLLYYWGIMDIVVLGYGSDRVYGRVGPRSYGEWVIVMGSGSYSGYGWYWVRPVVLLGTHGVEVLGTHGWWFWVRVPGTSVEWGTSRENGGDIWYSWWDMGRMVDCGYGGYLVYGAYGHRVRVWWTRDLVRGYSIGDMGHMGIWGIIPMGLMGTYCTICEMVGSWGTSVIGVGWVLGDGYYWGMGNSGMGRGSLGGWLGRIGGMVELLWYLVMVYGHLVVWVECVMGPLGSKGLVDLLWIRSSVGYGYGHVVYGGILWDVDGPMALVELYCSSGLWGLWHLGLGAYRYGWVLGESEGSSRDMGKGRYWVPVPPVCDPIGSVVAFGTWVSILMGIVECGWVWWNVDGTGNGGLWHLWWWGIGGMVLEAALDGWVGGFMVDLLDGYVVVDGCREFVEVLGAYCTCVV